MPVKVNLQDGEAKMKKLDVEDVMEMEWTYIYSDSASHYYSSGNDKWGWNYTLVITPSARTARVMYNTVYIAWEGQCCVCGQVVRDNHNGFNGGHYNEAGGYCCPHYGNTCGYHN